MSAARGGTLTVTVLGEHETWDGDRCEFHVDGTAEIEPADPVLGLGACVTDWPTTVPRVCPSCEASLSATVQAAVRQRLADAVERALDPSADWRVW